MEIIDILIPNAGGGGTFTVNVAASSVPLFAPLIFNKMYTPSGKGLFARGDNLIILSAGYIMPESFVMANQTGKPAAAIALVAHKNIAGTDILITSFGNSGSVYVPFVNYEISIGVFVDTENLLINEDFYLQSVFPGNSLGAEPEISMNNVPAAFDGLTFEVMPFIKVLHNTALS